MTSLNLGMPAAPPVPLAPRRKTRQLLLNHPTHPVLVGGDAPIS
ncbi:MAG: 4-hydroxy-3-methylbut-2-en-1-yl diphosphate synthase, partial [Actinobacteria bacterium]|nr:4-hydroxy-3-methylbut-2-en-1-yl diphosphate synthase [Actinomycetota bacterium]